jgi:pimeloyl-ACP methyl ester carboxylesterase
LFSLPYARAYPDQVTGLIMIDTVTPHMMTALVAQWPEYQRAAVHLPDMVSGYQSEQYDPTVSIEQINAAAPLRAIPVIILLGDKPEQADRQFAAGIPGATVTVVPGTTHYVRTQRPDPVIAAIRQMVH